MIVLLVRSTLKEAAAPTRNWFLDAWEGLRRAVRLALLVTGNAVWDLLLQANLLLFHAVARPANFRARRARRAGHPKLVERSRVDPIACFRDTGSTRHFMAPRNGDEERRVITVALLSRRRPPAGKPPTTADRKVTKSSTGHPRTAPAPCRTKPAAGMSRGRPGRRSMSRWIGPACAWAVGNGSPRQGTEEPRWHSSGFQSDAP